MTIGSCRWGTRINWRIQEDYPPSETPCLLLVDWTGVFRCAGGESVFERAGEGFGRLWPFVTDLFTFFAFGCLPDEEELEELELWTLVKTNFRSYLESESESEELSDEEEEDEDDELEDEDDELGDEDDELDEDDEDDELDDTDDTGDDRFRFSDFNFTWTLASASLCC